MGWIDSRKEKHSLTVCWSTLNFSALTQAVDSKHSRELVKHLLRIKMDQCTGIQIPIRTVMMNKKNCRDDQNSTKTCLLYKLSLALCLTIVIHLELLEQRERFVVFICNKMIILVCPLGWCGILYEWNHCRLKFFLSTDEALYCIRVGTNGTIA